MFPVHLRSLAYPRRWRKNLPMLRCNAAKSTGFAKWPWQYDFNCTAVENEVADNMYQRSELDYLIYNDPLAYADLVLNGNPEAYLKSVTEYKPLD